VPVAVT
jgi:hypothetical protein